MTVTLRSPSVLIRQLKLQATCTFSDTCKHPVVNTCYISEVRTLERLQTAKVIFKVTQGQWYWCRSIGHIQFPISLPLQLCLTISEILSTIFQYLEVTWPWTHPSGSWVICHARTTSSTPMYQSHTKLECLSSPITKMTGAPKFKMDHVIVTTPLSGVVSNAWARTCYG